MNTASAAYTDIRRSRFPLLQPFPKVSIRDRPRSRVAPCSFSGLLGCSWVSMTFNIPVVRSARAVAAATLLTSPALLSAQTPCSAAADSVLESGWRAYRADSLPAALSRFDLAHELCPSNLDATVGLGFTLLRSSQPRRAD